jgi:hypothetical protein
VRYDDLGNAGDLVKRAFLGWADEFGYQIRVDPLLTCAFDHASDAAYWSILGATANPSDTGKPIFRLLDPTKGILPNPNDPEHPVGRTQNPDRISHDRIARATDESKIVMVYDKSIDRRRDRPVPGDQTLQMLEKLRHLGEKKVWAFYYYGSSISTYYLFASRDKETLDDFYNKLISAGISDRQFVRLSP